MTPTCAKLRVARSFERLETRTSVYFTGREDTCPPLTPSGALGAGSVLPLVTARNAASRGAPSCGAGPGSASRWNSAVDELAPAEPSAASAATRVVVPDRLADRGRLGDLRSLLRRTRVGRRGFRGRRGTIRGAGSSRCRSFRRGLGRHAAARRPAGRHGCTGGPTTAPTTATAASAMATSGKRLALTGQPGNGRQQHDGESDLSSHLIHSFKRNGETY